MELIKDPLKNGLIDWWNWSTIHWKMDWLINGIDQRSTENGLTDWLARNIVFVSDFQSIEEEWCQPMRASVITS